MRNSYTAACIVKLLKEEVEFGWVGGVSAGSSHTVNFLSRDVVRSEESFVDFAKNPSFGGLGSLLRGSGYFNAEFIYEKAADQDMPFDWEAFAANPAQVCISAARADTGESVYWGREDIKTQEDLMVRVRASSTLPLIMPMRVIDGAPYVDGAMGESGGILIEQAEKDLKLYGTPTYLLLDECHRWSKTQSDSILPALESGIVRFIGSTTENPMVSMTGAVVSRRKS